MWRMILQVILRLFGALHAGRHLMGACLSASLIGVGVLDNNQDVVLSNIHAAHHFFHEEAICPNKHQEMQWAI